MAEAKFDLRRLFHDPPDIDLHFPSRNSPKSENSLPSLFISPNGQEQYIAKLKEIAEANSFSEIPDMAQSASAEPKRKRPCNSIEPTKELDVVHSTPADLDKEPGSLPISPKIHERPPNIFLRVFSDFQNTLQDLNLKFASICNISITHKGDYFQISSNFLTTHSAVVDFLKSNNHGFYLGSSTANPLRVVIKELPPDTYCEDILFGLHSLGFAEASNVNQLKSRADKRPLCIFQVDLDKTPTSLKILKLSKFMHLQVSVETFKYKKRPTQCFNCNHFFHLGNNCFMPTRCLRCCGSHQTRDCTHAKSKNPTCINCLETGHVASSRKCPFFPKSFTHSKRKPRKVKKTKNPLPPSIPLIKPTDC